MTLKDIARLAGVAPSTVSRVLSQPESSAASAETRARIWEIVRANGYTPNPNARALRIGADAPKNRSLCCIYARSDEMLGGPFFSRIAQAMEQEAFGGDIFCVIRCQPNGSTAKRWTQSAPTQSTAQWC